MNTYILRQAYGSTEMLIEFVHGPERKEFLAEIHEALSPLEVRIESQGLMMMNDESMVCFSSNQGPFSLSIDIWDLAFIMAETNQECILAIDKLLSAHPKFQKKEVDNKQDQSDS